MPRSTGRYYKHTRVWNIPIDVRTVKFAKQILGCSVRGTRTRTAVATMATQPAQIPVYYYKHVFFSEKAHSGCLTWFLFKRQITFTCRLLSNAYPVTIIDNNDKRFAECSLPSPGSGKNCTFFQKTEVVGVLISILKLTIIVQRSKISDYNGVWKCHQNEAEYKSNITTSIGNLAQINIKLYHIIRAWKVHTEILHFVFITNS